MVDQRTYSESHRDVLSFLNNPSCHRAVYKQRETLGAEVEELFALHVLLFFGQTVFGLSYLKLAVTEKGDKADS